jgi:GT2 family glycosyltransferase
VITACTVWSGRSINFKAVAKNHLEIADVDRHVWLLNGLSSAQHESFEKIAHTTRQWITLIKSPRLLPIARAYNRVFQEAQKEKGSDFFVIQDDILAESCSATVLKKSRYDLPALWHVDRPIREYEICGLPYVVFMAALIRRRVFDEIGYLWEVFLRGCDSEYGIRASLSGFRLGFEFDPRVKHLGGTTTGGDNASVRMVHQQAKLLIEYLVENGVMGGYREPVLDDRAGTKFVVKHYNANGRSTLVPAPQHAESVR